MNRERLYREMERQGLDYLLMCRIDNVDYLTGIAQPASFGAYVDNAEGMPFAYALVSRRERKVTLIISDMYRYVVERAAAGVIADETVFFKQFSYLEEIHGGKVICDLISSHLPHGVLGIHMGIEIGCIPALIYNMLSSRGIEMCDALKLMWYARMVKTPREVAKIREVCAIEDIAQERLLQYARDFHGETDLEMWAGITYEMNKKAGRVLDVSGELATGPAAGTSNYPSGPSGRRVQAGELGRMDISIRPDGYWCDCTNTVVFGAEPTAAQRDLFKIIIEAYDTAREFLRPGNDLYDVHKSCLDTYAKYGYASDVYSGHQMGCGANEPPRILNYEHVPIEAGMVVCLEPQQYIPGDPPLGVRLEHVILVTENGPEDLNKFQWGCGN